MTFTPGSPLNDGDEPTGEEGLKEIIEERDKELKDLKNMRKITHIIRSNGDHNDGGGSGQADLIFERISSISCLLFI